MPESDTDRGEVTGTKRCGRCRLDLPVAKFSIRRDGPYKHKKRIKRQSWCMRCTNNHWRDRPKTRIQRLAVNLRKVDGRMTVRELEGLGEPDYCYLCGEPIEGCDVEIDHVIPRYQDGPTTVDNLRCTHTDCNRAKGRLRLDQYLLKAAMTLSFQLVENPDLMFKDLDVMKALQKLVLEGKRELAVQASKTT